MMRCVKRWCNVFKQYVEIKEDSNHCACGALFR